MNNTDWNRYLGPHVTPQQYAAQGGTRQTLIRDLTQLWGNPSQGDDYLPQRKIRVLASKLARQLPQ